MLACTSHFSTDLYQWSVIELWREIYTRSCRQSLVAFWINRHMLACTSHFSTDLYQWSIIELWRDFLLISSNRWKKIFSPKKVSLILVTRLELFVADFIRRWRWFKRNGVGVCLRRCRGDERERETEGERESLFGRKRAKPRVKTDRKLCSPVSGPVSFSFL